MATPIGNYSKKSDSRLNEKSTGHQKYAEIQDQQIKPRYYYMHIIFQLLQKKVQ